MIFLNYLAQLFIKLNHTIGGERVRQTHIQLGSTKFINHCYLTVTYKIIVQRDSLKYTTIRRQN